MPIISQSAASSGGGLPTGWTTSGSTLIANGGTLDMSGGNVTAANSGLGDQSVFATWADMNGRVAASANYGLEAASPIAHKPSLQMWDEGFNNLVWMFFSHTLPDDADVPTGVTALWYDQTAGAPKLKFKRKDVAGTVTVGTLAPLAATSPVETITSGALPTVTCASGTGRQVITTRDVETHTPVTFNPGVATTATCKVELSPDNSTYTELATVTKPVGTVFDGEIEDVVVRVPASWYIRLTVNAQAAIGTTTYY